MTLSTRKYEFNSLYFGSDNGFANLPVEWRWSMFDYNDSIHPTTQIFLHLQDVYVLSISTTKESLQFYRSNWFFKELLAS